MGCAARGAGWSDRAFGGIGAPGLKKIFGTKPIWSWGAGRLAAWGRARWRSPGLGVGEDSVGCQDAGGCGGRAAERGIRVERGLHLRLIAGRREGFRWSKREVLGSAGKSVCAFLSPMGRCGGGGPSVEESGQLQGPSAAAVGGGIEKAGAGNDGETRNLDRRQAGAGDGPSRGSGGEAHDAEVTGGV